MSDRQIFYKLCNGKYQSLRRSDKKAVTINYGRVYTGELDTGEGCIVIIPLHVSALSQLGTYPIVIKKDSGAVLDNFHNFYITPDDKFNVEQAP